MAEKSTNELMTAQEVIDKFRELNKFHPTHKSKTIKNGVLQVKETGRNYCNYEEGEKDVLYRTFQPYTKTVEVDGVGIKLNMIRITALCVDRYGNRYGEGTESMHLTDEWKRMILYWYVGAMRKYGTKERPEKAYYYNQVLNELNTEDTYFMNKFFDDLYRSDLYNQDIDLVCGGIEK